MMSTETQRDAGLRKETSVMDAFTQGRVAVGFGSPAGPAATEPGGQQQQNQPGPGEPSQQQNPPPAKTNEQEENAVAKAYEKLRTAEEEAKTLKKENNTLKPENENLKGENETLKTQNAELQKTLTINTAERVATLKGFTDPEAAVAVLVQRGTDLSDRSKAEKALDDYAKEKGIVANQQPPSGGPINPQNQQTPTGNSGMNDMIRRSAGRG